MTQSIRLEIMRAGYYYCFALLMLTLVHLTRAQYDFIVIGSGPGGSTVTNRLTEVPEWSVLLLEAGEDESSVTDVPALFETLKRTSYNWGYRAEPQSNACLGTRNRRCPWPRGKALGGTTVINNMLYTRGHWMDYDGWAAMGNSGWGWNDVFKYFLKSENSKVFSSEFHATGGYLDIERPYTFPISKAFIKSGIELGYPVIDHNAGVLNGFSFPQATMRHGTRCSANKAFLKSIRNRTNLHISTRSMVTKILINPVDNKAFGVKYYKNGKYRAAYANKEVILSAGAINTPQLLMLSGIGPREHLESLDINVIRDSPGVGSNLQEHVEMPAVTFIVNDTLTALGRRLSLDVTSVMNYALHGKGPLTSTFTDGLAYVKLSESSIDYPDLELIFVPGSLASDDGLALSKHAGYRNYIYNKVYAPLHGKDTFSIWPVLLRPKSRGAIKLKSKNPFLWPLMYSNYFENEHDLYTMVAGIKFIVTLSETNAFQKYNTTLHTTPIPGCETHQFASDEYWQCVTRVMTISGHHQCCTAKMGPEHDPMAVVDPELRVHGVQNLRVVDASIMPNIIAGHTMAPTYMIAEKAADVIKLTHGVLL